MYILALRRLLINENDECSMALKVDNFFSNRVKGIKAITFPSPL